MIEFHFGDEGGQRREVGGRKKEDRGKGGGKIQIKC